MFMKDILLIKEIPAPALGGVGQDHLENEEDEHHVISNVIEVRLLSTPSKPTNARVD